jgi:hypothetical protein
MHAHARQPTHRAHVGARSGGLQPPMKRRRGGGEPRGARPIGDQHDRLIVLARGQARLE